MVTIEQFAAIRALMETGTPSPAMVIVQAVVATKAGGGTTEEKWAAIEKVIVAASDADIGEALEILS